MVAKGAVKEIDSRRVFKFLLNESFKQGALVRALILMPVSAFAVGTAMPFLISSLLAHLAQGTIQDFAPRGILLLIIAATVGVIANRLAFMSLLNSQALTLERLQSELFENLLDKDRSFFSNRMTGKITSDVISLQSAVIQFQDLLTINALPFATNIIFGIILVGIHSITLALGLFFISTVVITSAVYYSKKRAPLRTIRHALRRDLHGFFADVISNNAAVKIFATEKEERSQHHSLNRKFTEARIADWRLVSIDGNNRIITILILQIAFILLVINLVQNNPSLLSTGIFAFSFTILLSNRLFEISTIVRGLEAAITDSSSAVAILDTEPTIVDRPGATSLSVVSGEIAFENVSFKYMDNSSDELLFSSLNLRIKPGEKLGLVGKSGGGKTTITNLVLRFHDIQNGKILIDGKDIAQVTQRSLRRSIAYVPQDPALFHRSLLENIRYGKPSASIKKVHEVIKLAHLDEFIRTLPESYDTLVGERGIKLSGGQRQRVAIARAMLKDAPILILDEATSALDSESELYIQDALWKLMEGRTAIVIAHRLSTIQKMDRIVVMDKGKIVEEGTHKELIRQDGIYASLWAHQSGGFIEE